MRLCMTDERTMYMVEEEVAIGVEREIEDMTAVVAAKKKRGCVKDENDFSFFFFEQVTIPIISSRWTTFHSPQVLVSI